MLAFKMTTVTITGFLLILTPPSWTLEVSPEKILIDALLANYNPIARPVTNHSHTVDVYVGFAFSGIVGVDEAEQSMTSHGELKVSWTDPFLTWNRSEYFDIESLHLPQTSIWTPDLVVKNSVVSVLEPIHTENVMVKVYHNGSLTWSPSGKFQTICNVLIGNFPFDTQTCHVMIASNTYDPDTLRTHMRQEPRSSFRDAHEDIRNNSQWRVLGEASHTVQTPNVERDILVFSLKVQRRWLYFAVNVVFPSCVLAILNIIVFLIPHDLSDKIGVSTTLVLAYVVFLVQITENTPTNSDQLPLISVMVLVMMSVSALDVVVCALLLRCRSHASSRAPPRWLLWLTRKKMSTSNVYSPSSADITSAVQVRTDKEDHYLSSKLSEGELWQRQWSGVIGTIDKSVMTFQLVFVLALHASIFVICLRRTL